MTTLTYLVVKPFVGTDRMSCIFIKPLFLFVWRPPVQRQINSSGTRTFHIRLCTLQLFFCSRKIFANAARRWRRVRQVRRCVDESQQLDAGRLIVLLPARRRQTIRRRRRRRRTRDREPQTGWPRLTRNWPQRTRPGSTRGRGKLLSGACAEVTLPYNERARDLTGCAGKIVKLKTSDRQRIASKATSHHGIKRMKVGLVVVLWLYYTGFTDTTASRLR